MHGSAVCLRHTKRPFSNRFENKHKPSPSHHSSLMRSPRRPRKANHLTARTECSNNCVCTIAARPSNPLRRSVTPHASQIRTHVRWSDHRAASSTSTQHLRIGRCHGHEHTPPVRSISITPLPLSRGNSHGRKLRGASSASSPRGALPAPRRQQRQTHVMPALRPPLGWHPPHFASATICCFCAADQNLRDDLLRSRQSARIHFHLVLQLTGKCRARDLRDRISTIYVPRPDPYEAAAADVVVVAVRWVDIERVLSPLPPWNNRIVIDATNPVTFLEPNSPDANDPKQPPGRLWH